MRTLSTRAAVVRASRPASVLLGAAAALLAAVPAAANSAPDAVAVRPPAIVRQGDAVAVAGDLVLEPTERGYRGSMPITVHNGGEEAGSFRLLFREPVAGSFRNQTKPEQFCQTETSYREHRKTFECSLQRIEPGGSLTFQIHFQVLTHTRDYAMSAADGRIAISGGWRYDDPFSEFADFGTLFRSTTGSLGNPQPYVQDQTPESSIVAADEMTMLRRADGWYEGRLRTTVRYDSDAAHEALQIDAPVAQDRAILVATDPVDDACWRGCFAPGGPFMEGEERTFDLVFEARPDAEPGQVEVNVTLAVLWHMVPVDEVNTSDNAVTFTLRIPETA